jgi:hypothetical protein
MGKQARYRDIGSPHRDPLTIILIKKIKKLFYLMSFGIGYFIGYILCFPFQLLKIF